MHPKYTPLIASMMINYVILNLMFNFKCLEATIENFHLIDGHIKETLALLALVKMLKIILEKQYNVKLDYIPLIVNTYKKFIVNIIKI